MSLNEGHLSPRKFHQILKRNKVFTAEWSNLWPVRPFLVPSATLKEKNIMTLLTPLSSVGDERAAFNIGKSMAFRGGVEGSL